MFGVARPVGVTQVWNRIKKNSSFSSSHLTVDRKQKIDFELLDTIYFDNEAVKDEKMKIYFPNTSDN